MEKHIPFEKLSKRKQREMNARRRNTWGALNPTTRRPANPKAYNRKKLKVQEDRSGNFELFLFSWECGAGSYDLLSV